MIKLFLSTLMFLFSIKNACAQNATENSIFSNTQPKYYIPLQDLKNLEGLNAGETLTVNLSSAVSLPMQINMNVWNDKTTHTIGAKILGDAEAYCTVTFYMDKGEEKIEGTLFSKQETFGFKIYKSDNLQVCFDQVNTNQIIVE
jgi:hypothetical protein